MNPNGVTQHQLKVREPEAFPAPFGDHGDFAGEWVKGCIACLQNAMTLKPDIAGPPRGQKGLPQSELLHFTPFSK